MSLGVISHYPNPIEGLEAVVWSQHAEEVLGGPHADEIIQRYMDFANEEDPDITNAAGIYFDPVDMFTAAGKRGDYEVESGRAEQVVFVNMLNGGTPYHTDIVAAMLLAPDAPDIREDHLRVSAYDENGKFVGAHVPEDEKFHPQTLEEGDLVVLVDDGDETGHSLEVAAEWLSENRGVTSFEALVSRSKKPDNLPAGISRKDFDHVTPLVYETFYGFHGKKDAGRDARGMGPAMLQPDDNDTLELLENVLITLGGKEGLARANMDEVRKYNRHYNDDWAP